MKPKRKVVGAASISSWQLVCAKTGPGSMLAVIFQAGVNINTNTAAVLVWDFEVGREWVKGRADANCHNIIGSFSQRAKIMSGRL